MPDATRQEVLDAIDRAKKAGCTAASDGARSRCGLNGACQCACAALAALDLDAVPVDPPAPWVRDAPMRTVVELDVSIVVSVSGHVSYLTGSEAREMAAALVAHADYLDPSGVVTDAPK